MADFRRLGRAFLGCGMVTALAVQAAAAPTTETYLNCTPKSRDVCQSGKACLRSAPEKMIFKVNPGNSTYSRCSPGRTASSLICDTYPVQIFSQWSGITVSPKEGSFFLQVDRKMQFSEVIGYGDRVEITRGTCQIAPPEIETIAK